MADWQGQAYGDNPVRQFSAGWLSDVSVSIGLSWLIARGTATGSLSMYC